MVRNDMRRVSVVPFLFAACVVGAAGCSGGGGGGKPGPGPDTDTTTTATAKPQPAGPAGVV